MMFITPIPPTISEMTAIDAISRVRVSVVLVIVARMSSVLRMKKSLVPWRAVRKVVTACSAASVSVSSLTRSVMLRSVVLPRNRACTVV